MPGEKREWIYLYAGNRRVHVSYFPNQVNDALALAPAYMHQYKEYSWARYI